MNFANSNLRCQQLLEWGGRIKGFLAEYEDERAVQEIEQAISHLKKNQIRVTILGKAKRGKSTLINAFLGRKDDILAPIDKLPASSVISRYIHSDCEKAVVYFRSGNSKDIIYTDIKQYIGRVSQLGPENDACLMKFAPHKLCFALGALPPNPRSFFRHGTIRHKPSGTITPAALPLAWLHCFC